MYNLAVGLPRIHDHLRGIENRLDLGLLSRLECHADSLGAGRARLDLRDRRIGQRHRLARIDGQGDFAILLVAADDVFDLQRACGRVDGRQAERLAEAGGIDAVLRGQHECHENHGRADDCGDNAGQQPIAARRSDFERGRGLCDIFCIPWP